MSFLRLAKMLFSSWIWKGSLEVMKANLLENQRIMFYMPVMKTAGSFSKVKSLRAITLAILMATAIDRSWTIWIIFWMDSLMDV